MSTRDEELRDQFHEQLYKAVRDGKLAETNSILDSQGPEAWNVRITDKDETALHVAVANGHEDIVKELVNNRIMSEKSLAMYDSDGYTALITAAVLGNMPMVECMLEKSPGLIKTKSTEGNLPVVMAIDFGQIQMARYLYVRTQRRAKELYPDQESQDHNGATLLTCAIYAGTLDGIHIALDLIERCPHLALAIDKYGESGILALASMRQSFPSGNQLGFWKQPIYSCLRKPSSPAIHETRNGEQGQSNQEEINRSGITQLYEMKKIHVLYNELLIQMCLVISESMISESKNQQLEDGLVYDAICQAAKNGIFEFVSEMLKTDRGFLWIKDGNKRNIFMLAVLHRQEKIFSILYSREMMMSYKAMKCLLDVDGNNILHMAGMIEHSTRVNQIPGAALQMQRELQWFKEVERIVRPKDKETINKLDAGNFTPRQLFTKNHENMMEKGEKWMKETARSCTVVGALIVTIMFAVAFTIPGGNDQDTGLPIFLNKKSFRVFMIFDALSFFLSSTSILMFLGILTSRYTEDDFLEYLPRQMIIGLSTLFCSIVTMMITFASALLIILHEQSRIAIPLICLGGVPVTIFLWIQRPILQDMIISTYGPSIFDRKMKLKL